jgi:hypothetical protein
MAGLTAFTRSCQACPYLFIFGSQQVQWDIPGRLQHQRHIHWGTAGLEHSRQIAASTLLLLLLLLLKLAVRRLQRQSCCRQVGSSLRVHQHTP